MSFESGDPRLVYEAVQRLAIAYRELHVEASKLRFKTNFGTALCTNCDGLKAGPGVVATCFQVRQCNFENIREGSPSEQHQRIIQSLSIIPKIRP